LNTIENRAGEIQLVAPASGRRGMPLGGRLMLALGLAVLAWAVPVGIFFLLR
jgi:hypothetical protein